MNYAACLRYVCTAQNYYCAEIRSLIDCTRRRARCAAPPATCYYFLCANMMILRCIVLQSDIDILYFVHFKHFKTLKSILKYWFTGASIIFVAE